MATRHVSLSTFIIFFELNISNFQRTWKSHFEKWIHTNINKANYFVIKNKSFVIPQYFSFFVVKRSVKRVNCLEKKEKLWEKMEKDLKNWMSIIQSCVASSKNPLTIRKLKDDIKKLEGKGIPFKQFQFKSLKKMLQNTPGLEVFQKAGQTYIKPISSKKTSNIAKTISKKKSTDKKKNRKMKINLNQIAKAYRSDKENNDSKEKENIFQLQTSEPINNNNLNDEKSSQHNESYEPKSKLLAKSDPETFQENLPNNEVIDNPQVYEPKQNEEMIGMCSCEICRPYMINQRLTEVRDKLHHFLWSKLDPCIRLLSYTLAKNLPEPHYESYWTNYNTIYSKVTVDQKTYTTSINSFDTKQEADEEVALVALGDILQNIKRQSTKLDDKCLITDCYTEKISEEIETLVDLLLRYK